MGKTVKNLLPGNNRDN